MSNLHLENQLKQLLLTTFAKKYLEVAIKSESRGATNVQYLEELVQQELEHRYQQRIIRLLKEAKLPRNKHLADFESNRIPGLSATLLQKLAQGEFIDSYENIIILGNPGTGKTHLSIALAREWCLQGRKVYFTNTAVLVQQLLVAKQSLQLNNIIKRLDRFEILLLDDISYIPYDRSETDVLFQLLAARYETRSVLITSNLPFAKWNTIFKDEMTTAAAIDRLVHHSTILELNTESYRVAQAKKKNSNKKQEVTTMVE